MSLNIAHTAVPASSGGTAFLKRPTRPTRILAVDDDVMNSDLLRNLLTAQGYIVETAKNGREALEIMQRELFDLVLLDILMPELNGHHTLLAMKSDPRLRDLPVVMISGLDDLNSIARCIEIGADDYLPKPFKPILLQARIGACLDRKHLRDQERAMFQALQESQQHLADELAEAERYVRSLLPEPLKEGTVRADWRFITSTSLGGDSFGYHWLDADNFAMYLLDVCGHGVGAALLSISAMNALRSCALPNTDFRNPGAVLCALNDAFQMDRHNNMYFTIWYGVFNKATRQLTYACGGHPPALLLDGAAGGDAVPLKAPGMVIGSMPGLPYRTATQNVSPNSRLYVFSDGVYEITRPNGTMWDYQEFVTLLTKTPAGEQSELDLVLKQAQTIQGSKTFTDDFSLVKFVLP